MKYDHVLGWYDDDPTHVEHENLMLSAVTVMSAS